MIIMTNFLNCDDDYVDDSYDDDSYDDDDDVEIE